MVSASARRRAVLTEGGGRLTGHGELERRARNKVKENSRGRPWRGILELFTVS